ncbi:MAG: hypothetical protein NZM33_06930, partial [Bryobacteraceae bacterium]|nr:hypothetical protein [Bryobacteraceae bacterium]
RVAATVPSSTLSFSPGSRVSTRPTGRGRNGCTASIDPAPRAVASREKGKVYFDYLQNGRGKTVSAPYVARPLPGAPVATPLEWAEVTPGLSPAQFHIRNVLERFERRGDLFEGVLRKPQRLEPALERLEQMVRQVR